MKQTWSVFRVVAFLLISAASVYYLVQLWDLRSEIPSIVFDWHTVGVLLSGILFVVLICGLGGWIWFLLLRDHRVNISLLEAIGIFQVSQFAKYFPGNVGHFVGRAAMAKSSGIPVSITVNTMLIEVLWGSAIAGGLALLSLVLFIDETLLGPQWTFGPWQLGTAAVLLLLLPWIAVYLINTFFPGLARWLSNGAGIASPRLSTALMVAALYLVSFAIIGVILKSQAYWFFGVSKGSIAAFSCVFAVAWLAGYVVPGAPGGLGVREAMMAVTLAPIVGEGAAVGLGITLRIATTLGDGLAFVIGLLVRRFANLPSIPA